MDQQKMFRVSFAYADEDEITGKPVKATKDILISAVNYTDAECLAHTIIPDLQAYSTDVAYEIKPVKKPLHLALTGEIDIAPELVCGLFNYFIDPELSQVSLFNVSAHLSETQDSGKIKTVVEEWLVPAENSRAAYDIVHKTLKKIDIRDFELKNIKFDKADELFYTESQHRGHVSRSELAEIL